MVERVFNSSSELTAAIDKLRRRLSEVEDLDPQAIRFDDQVVSNIEFSIRTTIGEVFGRRSPEFDHYQHWSIWEGPT